MRHCSRFSTNKGPFGGKQKRRPARGVLGGVARKFSEKSAFLPRFLHAEMKLLKF
jgi:hypothetical protein